MSLAYNELKKGMALDIDGKPCILSQEKVYRFGWRPRGWERQIPLVA